MIRFYLFSGLLGMIFFLILKTLLFEQIISLFHMSFLIYFVMKTIDMYYDIEKHIENGELPPDYLD